ncbi:hypothetical protein [Niabella hirudinis]|uniref:hypothetical protein n=1 Tax=Niabella hirudinis TaxID=1285929 RepID=UPI003EBE1E7A
MEDHQDDFLKHIKEVLGSHEEAYRQGAWEQFSRQHLQSSSSKRGRVVPLWRRVAIAAALLAGIFLAAYYFMPGGSNHPPDFVKTAPAPLQNISPDPGQNASAQHNAPTPSPEEHLPVSRKKQPAAVSFAGNDNRQIAQNDILPVSPAPPAAPVRERTENGQTPSNAPAPPNQVTPGREITKPFVNRPHNPTPLFAHELPEAADNKRSKRWTPSVYISPMFGESDVNMGYGIALGYAVNDKIKVSAGIAHNKMTASRDFDVSFSASGAALNGSSGSTFAKSTARSLVSKSAAAPQQQLERVNATLSGFDIPVDISYNFTSRLYATAGVSGMVVVKDNALYYYKDAENQQISVENNQGILKEDKNIQIITSTVSSAAPEASEKERTPFLGFYNLSFGYKQKVTNKNNVAIEPFLKVPMKNVSDQKLNYTGMGIRLKFDF